MLNLEQLIEVAQASRKFFDRLLLIDEAFGKLYE